MQFAIGSWAGQSMFNLLKKRKHEEISRNPARTVSHGLVQSVDNAPRLRCYRETQGPNHSITTVLTTSELL